MLQHCIRVLNKHNYVVGKGFATSSVIKDKWDLLTAVCLERKPIVTPVPSELEEKFQKLLAEVEYEHSLKSDHELRHEQDLKQQELLKKGDVDVDVSVKETAQDYFDACSEELTQFKFGSRITEADKSNNVKSLNRKLDKHLILLLRQQIGGKSYFLLPQGTRQDGETLRQTAERILKETCGSNIKAQFYGNAPSGFYKYKYPKDVQKEGSPVGAKVFIYFAKYCNGQLPEKKQEFKWLDRVELRKELNPNYHDSIAQFLIDER